MDIEKIHAAVKAQREASFEDSSQLTLGELLTLLEDIPTEWGSDKEAVTISFDFGTAYPTGFSSWRGSYDEVTINYALSGYDAEQFAHTGLKEFKQWLRETIGKEFQGWKGGDYTMTANTPVWVANDGNVGNTGVSGIRDNEYEVVLLTGWYEW